MDAPIITLTADWGPCGFFAGMVKGQLYSRIPNLRIVDIDLNIAPLNTIQASFVVRHACPTFPQGTVHIIDVASTPTPRHPFVVVGAHGQYYICCDNGIPATALGSAIDEAYELELPTGGFYNFAAYDLFAPLAAAIVAGKPLHELGRLRNALTPMFQPTYVTITEGLAYRIFVHYIDNYGNLYLGMTYDQFRHIGYGREFTLQVRDKRFTEIRSTYQPKDPKKNEKDEENKKDIGSEDYCLTVSATGLLEVALCGKSFINLVGGVKLGESVLLSFT